MIRDVVPCHMIAPHSEHRWGPQDTVVLPHECPGVKAPAGGDSMSAPDEPTADQCSEQAQVRTPLGMGHALWYPQMGGYVGRAVAYTPGDGCAEVWVWHDGDFPFSEDGRSPAELHHCDPRQFVEFGETLLHLAAISQETA